jgi:hypothetical protein
MGLKPCHHPNPDRLIERPGARGVRKLVKIDAVIDRVEKRFLNVQMLRTWLLQQPMFVRQTLPIARVMRSFRIAPGLFTAG